MSPGPRRSAIKEMRLTPANTYMEPLARQPPENCISSFAGLHGDPSTPARIESAPGGSPLHRGPHHRSPAVRDGALFAHPIRPSQR